LQSPKKRASKRSSLTSRAVGERLRPILFRELVGGRQWVRVAIREIRAKSNTRRKPMNDNTKRSVEIAIAYCGPLFVLSYTFFWGILGHNIPPPNMMGMTGEQLIAEYYGKYPEIGVGMIGAAFAGLLYLPWSCLLASMLRDRDGNLGVLSLMELSGGLLTAWLLAFCSAMWGACAILVAQVDPSVIKLMHTMTWFIFDCTYMITTIQLTGLGVYVILNRQQSIFPSWAGWCALATGASFIPLSIMPFVSDGPFVVPGMWNFYIVFGLWLIAFFCVFSFFMLKHLHGVKGSSVHGAHAVGTA
jgi:hypothetical protein